MKLDGEYQLPASRETVWQALNDPDVLRQCIPGCESFEKVSDTEFEAVALLKVGPVKARFKGRVSLSDIDPMKGYRIAGEGKGGAAGFARGAAVVALEPAGPDCTVLSYAIDGAVGGKLAQVGQRLLRGSAKKLGDRFFANFSEYLAGEA